MRRSRLRDKMLLQQPLLPRRVRKHVINQHRLTRIFDEITTTTATPSLVFDRTPATKRDADQLDTQGNRTPSQYQKVTRNTHRTSCPRGAGTVSTIENRAFVNGLFLQVKSGVITLANEHGRCGLGTLASLPSEQPKQLVCGALTCELFLYTRTYRSSAGTVCGPGLVYFEPRTAF